MSKQSWSESSLRRLRSSALDTAMVGAVSSPQIVHKSTCGLRGVERQGRSHVKAAEASAVSEMVKCTMYHVLLCAIKVSVAHSTLSIVM